ncbi:unnamed protein product [Ectocarpus sp. 4 AP-2014]
MYGPFPSARTCRLEALCTTTTKNADSFRADFNEHKTLFLKDRENLRYGGIYGKIDIRQGPWFTKTRRVLATCAEYVRIQAFNDYAGYDFLSTTFTVLYPGGAIRPHFGATNSKYRVHLCLDIDGTGGIVTAYGTKFWEDGSIFISRRFASSRGFLRRHATPSNHHGRHSKARPQLSACRKYI